MLIVGRQFDSPLRQNTPTPSARGSDDLWVWHRRKLWAISHGLFPEAISTSLLPRCCGLWDVVCSVREVKMRRHICGIWQLQVCSKIILQTSWWLRCLFLLDFFDVLWFHISMHVVCYNPFHVCNVPEFVAWCLIFHAKSSFFFAFYSVLWSGN